MADTHVEGTLDGVRGVELYWQGWLPPTDPTGVLLLCHGLGEHSGRYGNVVDAVTPDGWAVYALDHRGHGRSGGRRAHLDDYADWLADFDTFRRHVVALHPGLPVFLLGHSMGGQIALAYALDHQADLQGLVLSAPALASNAVPKVAVPVLTLLARVAPTLRPAGIDGTKVSKDPAVVAAYQADPLVYQGNPTLGLSARLFAQFDVLPERARGLTLPLLLQHGTDDVLTEPSGTRLLESTSGSPDQTVRWYEGLWHEIYNEPEREAPLADLREWLAAHR
ncbi:MULTISPECIES: alpha/beta hydrolase [unclassified Pseudonocardia]|jgi:alpha-beta hydrolase superfamily lysophospholipase|uniref:alpha/beta hydrolase n=1 Tax=unclassified Pseudonocardia TaxID=2619320 RepID=UPI000969E8D3|nr:MULTISPECIES: alpha/beta hydrolase [unclassified Pseudonocardia]MBN9100903.1 lysophospholipase [Pseudonocardia sp.]OJY51596.1 MAG: alpha/beta hydrolase [Pseudonocardia sp. 73-21]